MVAQDYRYTSEDTLRYLSLHDCDCSHLYYAEDCLVFVMEWLEVLSSHPLNPFPQAHQSGGGRIELVRPRIVSCSIARREGSRVQNVSDVGELDYSGLEFLDCEETDRRTKEGVYHAKMYLIFDRDSNYSDISLEVEYEKSRVMWDAFHGVSWFECIGQS